MPDRDTKPRPIKIQPYKGAAGGWGSMEGMGKVIVREAPPAASV